LVEPWLYTWYSSAAEPLGDDLAIRQWASTAARKASRRPFCSVPRTRRSRLKLPHQPRLRERQIDLLLGQLSSPPTFQQVDDLPLLRRPLRLGFRLPCPSGRRCTSFPSFRFWHGSTP